MKYLVIECHESYAVVLDEDGAFIRCANFHYEIGQTLYEITPMQLPPESRVIHTRWHKQIAAFAACILLVIGMVIWNQMPYASVNMTINPEVQIDVNRADKVVSVKGINEDGADLIRDYAYRGKSLDLVMDELLDRAIEMQYLSDGARIVLTFDANDEWIIGHSESLSKQMQSYVSDRMTVSVDIPAVPTPDVAETEDAGTVDRDYGTSDSTAETSVSPDVTTPLYTQTGEWEDVTTFDYDDNPSTATAPPDTTPHTSFDGDIDDDHDDYDDYDDDDDGFDDGYDDDDDRDIDGVGTRDYD